MAGTMKMGACKLYRAQVVSMESGLDGRNNMISALQQKTDDTMSQWSPA